MVIFTDIVSYIKKKMSTNINWAWFFKVINLHKVTNHYFFIKGIHLHITYIFVIHYVINWFLLWTTIFIIHTVFTNNIYQLLCRVKNIKNLRVVDASIMPNITSGNTNIPTMMIAEKASDMIKQGIFCERQNDIQDAFLGHWIKVVNTNTLINVS